MSNNIALITFNNIHYAARATEIHIGAHGAWSVKVSSGWVNGFTFGPDTNRRIRAAIARQK